MYTLAHAPSWNMTSWLTSFLKCDFMTDEYEFNKVVWKSTNIEHNTPLDLYKQLDEEFHFTLDPCTTEDNPLGTPNFFTKKDDGLKQPWKGHTVYVNPPYSRKRGEPYDWIKKAYIESRDSNTTVVMLLASRTGTRWFHEFCTKAEEVRFLKGRLKFSGMQNSAPFDSLVVIFTGQNDHTREAD